MRKRDRQIRMAAADHAVSILCPGCFIKAAEAEGHPRAEHSWRVTSDSIAAWTAHVLGATELVLVKSRDVSCEMTPTAAAQAGLVDELFPDHCRKPADHLLGQRSQRPARDRELEVS